MQKGYFQAYEKYFWEWDTASDGVFVCITDGKTIAHEDYVLEVLEYLSDDGLPPFGALLLVLIATFPDGGEALERISVFLKERKRTFSEGAYVPDLKAAMLFLETLNSLEEYKTGEKKLVLLQTIFSGCHNSIIGEKAKSIVREYPRGSEFIEKTPFSTANFVNDFKTLELLGRKFSTADAIVAAMGGLPETAVASLIDDDVLDAASLAAQSTDLIRDLIEDYETFEVGSLIKRIWSGLNIPLHHNIPSAQPLGGISDLSNKGDFDKLLISEFANDDDVFMSRIANNEALFIQREVPPEADKFERIILMDSSMKNWGNAKALNFATALAIARHPKTDIKCRLFVLGNSFEEVFFDNTSTVISGLNLLSPTLDCANGLAAYIDADTAGKTEHELFFIGSGPAMQQPAMLKAMSDYAEKLQYVITTYTEGSIDFFRNQNKGKKLLQRIVLPLDSIWDEMPQMVKNKPQLRRRETLVVRDIPILYPLERSYQHIFIFEKEKYCYVHGGVYRFASDLNKGFALIASGLPFKNGAFTMRRNLADETELVVYLDFHVIITNLETREQKSRRVYSKSFETASITLFIKDTVIYLTDGHYFWQLRDDEKLLRENGNWKDYYNPINFEMENFKHRYKYSNIRYHTLKRLLSVALKGGDLVVNGYHLANGYFYKKSNQTLVELGKPTLQFTPKVNLVLKSCGPNTLRIIQILKDRVGMSLSDAKNLVGRQLPVIASDIFGDKAEALKTEFESNGAICYVEYVSFIANESSSISIENGVLVFESSDPRIGVFYMPFITDMLSAGASATHFAGNEYFLPKETMLQSIDYSAFEAHYLKPFIKTILEHGA